MSKYWILKMRIYLILIILGFTQSLYCSDLSNVSSDDNYPVCPVNSFRKKRALLEYTRWRANLETTQEFIVKVLDEDLTTPNMKEIVAINIQPVTKGGEKIIVGGVVVPPVTTAQTTPDLLRDYTRFVPPTTIPVANIDGELFLAPAKLPRPLDKIPPIKPKVGRNSQRDESPPASPQFLARTPTLVARQYAPIAPVAFNRRENVSPLRPPSATPYKTQESSAIDIMKRPTRTSTMPDILWPTRTDTVSDEYKGYQKFIDKDTQLNSDHLLMMSSFQSTVSPVRTRTITDSYFDSENEGTTKSQSSYEESKSIDQEARKKIEKYLHKADKDSDAFYNMIFYNDEDGESSSKKSKQDLTENYDDKIESHGEADMTTEKVDITNVPVKKTTEFEIPADHDYENPVEKNVTQNNSVRRVLGTEATESTTQISSKEKSRGKRKPVCNLLKLRQLNFNSPRTLPEIVSQLKQWAENSPVTKWQDITRGNLTTMDNPIYMMIVDDPSSGQIVSAKQTVMIVAGIQGRDHHAVAAAMYVLYQLIERSEAHADLLTKFRFWIIPVFNPDGYDYSMTFPHRREWTKNLRQNWDICKSRDSCISCASHGLRCTVQPCYGVNLDRNFEYQWIPPDELKAEHPCGSLHAGARQLSEAETWALTRFLHDQNMPLYTFIAFKEGEVLGVMYPYSHTRKLRAFDHVYRQRASRASSAAYSISGRPYVAGQTSEFLPLYAGGMEDWVDGHLGIDNTYTIMMFRPTDSYNSKLITERVVHEAYAAMDTLLLQSVEPLGPPAVSLKRSNGASKIHPQYFIIYCAIVITCELSRFTTTLSINN